MPRSILAAMAGLSCLLAATLAQADGRQVELKIGGHMALADLAVPEGGSVENGVLLITHGTLAHKDMEIVEALQQAFAERGIATLAHSLTFSVDRRKGMYDCAVPHRHAHGDGVAEIAAWADWLRANGAKKVWVLGHSRGGNQVAWFAAEKGGVDKVVLLAPALSLPGKAAADILKQRFGADILPELKKASALVAEGKGETMLDVPAFVMCQGGKASARSIVSFYGEDPKRDGIANIRRIEAPVLVIAAGKDTAVPDVPERIKPVADGKKVRLAVVDGADHMFLDFFADDAAELVAEFLKE